MADGFIHWDDEDNNNNQNKNEKHGILPEGTYGTDTEIYYCCSDQGNWYDPIELPVGVPIFLLPYNSKNCQRVKWAWSKQQYITYDTENTQNLDNFVRRHVYAENKRKDLPTTIYYCYYEGMYITFYIIASFQNTVPNCLARDDDVHNKLDHAGRSSFNCSVWIRYST